jgi:hypothetical protein
MIGKKLNFVLLALMLVLSILGAAIPASAMEYHTLNVNSNVVPDKIEITGTSSVTNTNCALSTNIPLKHGTYTVTVSKEGYKSETVTGVSISDYDSNADGVVDAKDITRVLVTLVAIPGGSQGGDNNGDTDDNGNTVSSDVYIKDVDFKDEVAPGDVVDFKIEVKNGAAYDAENVVVTVTIKDIDDGDDIDAESDDFTLDAKGADHNADEEEVTLSLTIPADADDKTFDVEVKVEWEQEDKIGTLESVKTYSIDVEKEDHAVKITDVQLDSETTKAGEQGQIAVTLQNVGSNDETVRFQVKSDQLGINVMSAQFKLDEGKESTQQLSFTVSDNVKVGKYFVYVTAYYGSLTAQSTVTLEVKAPAQSTTAPTGPVTVTPVTVTTATESANEPAASGGLAGWIIAAIVLIAIVGMIVKDVVPEVTAKPTIIKASRR